MQIGKMWCGRTEVFVRPLEQMYSEQAEGESDLKRMCQPGESCKNQVGYFLHVGEWMQWLPTWVRGDEIPPSFLIWILPRLNSIRREIIEKIRNEENFRIQKTNYNHNTLALTPQAWLASGFFQYWI